MKKNFNLILSTIPHVPGIYFFKNASGQVIYIGKAKDLNKRIRSYFSDSYTDQKIETMVKEIVSVDYLPTRSELEALLLEATIINQEQPHYNMLLKEGQPFLYLLFTNQEIPHLKLVRNKKLKGTYFGPFINKQEARRVYSFLIRTFKLQLCNKKIENGCLDYHIGICPGSCRSDFDKDAYLFRLELVKKLLRGKYQELLANIKHHIASHSKHLEFEQAQYLSEVLSSMKFIMSSVKTHFDPKKFESDLAIKTTPTHHRPQKNKLLGKELQQLLGLKKAPSSIDCFDVSHFQSRSIVGSCIRFVNGLPDKNNFRKFRIRTLTQQNDYAALQEIVRRRYRNPKNLPDLILIDGGKGQRNAVKDIFSEIECISIVKREERVFSNAHPKGVVLDMQTDTGKTLIALRDYAHHFAISYHRKQQSLR